MLMSFSTSSRRSVLVVLAGVLIAEMLIISLMYQHNFNFTCRDTAPVWFCAFAGRIVPRILAVLAGLALFAVAQPQAIGRLIRAGADHPAAAFGLQILGFLLILAPWFVLSDASSPGVVLAGALAWSIGGLLAALGTLGVLASWAAWKEVLRDYGVMLGMLIVVALALPELADLLQPLWRFEWVTDLTFRAVHLVLSALGYPVIDNPATKEIGTLEFWVAVGPQCSGVEGFALITVFWALYLALFRQSLAFPQVFLLWPIGILISWCFNVLRISALLVLGIEVSPELAIGGFHSHAGWLSFTILSVALILISQAIPFFRRTGSTQRSRSLPPFFRDPVVAEILPFAVFMFSALLASTFTESPGVVYPMRLALMAGVLALFWPVIRALPWRLDPLAAGLGLVIGALWVLTAPAADGPVAHGGLTGVALLGWVLTRTIGTSLMVPLIEELFFRGYLLRRIGGDGPPWRLWLAVAVSAALFAALHDRWIAAALAGVVFGALVVRSRNLTDAILSHALANVTIALWAIATGAWHII